MSKLKKRILALGMALVMAVSMIPMFASLALADEAPATINVYLTVSNQGELAKANDGSLMVWKPVTVTDLDADGMFTFDEALIAAHKTYNTEEGYARYSSGWVYSLWGDSTTGAYSFVDNNEMTDVVTTTFIQENDYLVAAIDCDAVTYTDFYAFYDSNIMAAVAGEDVTLTLKGRSVMFGGDADVLPGLSVGYYTENGAYTDLNVKTDESGKATVSFDEPGTYYVSAKGSLDRTIASWDFSESSEYPGIYMKTDWSTYDVFVPYTEKDHGNGPYPIDELKYMDYEDWDDMKEEEQAEYHVMKSNKLIVNAPITAPVIILKVVPAVADGTYALPALKAGPSDMFNHFVANSAFLIVDGDNATIRFITDGSTASVQKYSRIALGHSNELVQTAYQQELAEGTTIIDGILNGDVTDKDQYLFEITLPKKDVEILLANDVEDDLYITVWNNQGASSNGNVPGWYKASKEIYLSLGKLGETATIPEFHAGKTFVDGTYKLEGLDGNFGMFKNIIEEDLSKIVVKNGVPYIVIISNSSKRFDQIILGKYDEVIDPLDIDGIEGFAREDGKDGLVFVVPTNLKTLRSFAAGDSLYYVVRYKKGYSADHDGDWYKAGEDPYLTVKDITKVSDATDLPVKPPVVISLLPTNEESMFKAVNAYIETKDDVSELVFALSSTGYEYVIPGSYYDVLAAQVGSSTETWVKYTKATVNCDYIQPTSSTDPTPVRKTEGEKEKYQFRLPIAELPESGTLRLPVVAVSKSKKDEAETANPENPDYSEAFTARQIVIDLDEKIAYVENLEETYDVTITCKGGSLNASEKGSILVKGYPTANEYRITLTLPVEDSIFDKAFVGTAEAAAAATETIALKDGKFEVLFANTRANISNPVINNGIAKAVFHVADDALCAEAGQWVEMTFVFAPHVKIVEISGEELTGAALELTNNVKMFSAKALSISGTEGAYKLHLSLGSGAFDKVFVGYASAAKDEEAIPITLTTGDDNKTTGAVDIPVASVKDPIVLAFYSVSKEKYYNRTLTIDLEAKKAVFDPTNISLDQFDGMTEEEAIARATADTSVDTVNALIEAIQVQTRDENTDKYCKLARVYYDALADSDKENLEDPGYFGDNTGDASLDDPRNQDGIGEKELLVVSFGTSFNESRVLTVKAIEDALAKAYPEYSVRRAFTAQIIINHIQSRDGEKIDNMQQALDRAVANNVKELVVQPTHLMHGAEYDEMCEALAEYEDKFDRITICEPLLNSDEDKEIVAKAVVDAAIKDSAYETLAAADADKTAIVLMGHGTSHEANVTYTEMQAIFAELGYKNVFVGTVEGKPASTALPEVKKAVENAGYTKVILRPLMVVAGDHANNDMAADEEGSWYYAFVNGGEFEVEGADEPVDIGTGFGKDNVTCQIAGLGESEAVQQLYVAHVAAAPADYSAVDAAIAKAKTLDSNLYTVKSFEKVAAAVNAVVEGKTILQQDEVDAMAKAIEEAIEGLVKVFADVANPDAWYYEVVYDILQVKNANGKSLMSGYADGSNRFGATDPLTRQDFAIILYRLADEPEVPEMANPFTDTSEKGYYYTSVLWAKAENVIAGYDNGKFGVGDKITREQVATILYRFAKDYLKLETTEEGELSKFSDGTAISSWAKEALTWATGAGIITGKENGTKIDARGNAARAEIAAMILRFLEYKRYKETTEVIAIIHTNDVHGHIEIEPYVKGLADKMKESGDYSLVLTVSAGDVYSQGNAVAGYYNGELIPAINDQVYDVIVPGNNDFPVGGLAGNAFLSSLYKNTKTICANIQVKADTDVAAYAAAYTAKIGNEDFAKMYDGVELKEDGTLDCSALNLGVVAKDDSPWQKTLIVKTENGTKLGLFGLTCIYGQMTGMGQSQGTVNAAKESVASLKADGANVIVGIGHTGWMGEGSTDPSQVNDTNSWVVANEVQDMDALIDSHTHSIINDGKGCYVGDNQVLVNQAGCFGEDIGIMYIYVKGGKVIDKKAEIIYGDALSTITPDKDVQATVDAALDRIHSIAGEPLAASPYFLNGGTDIKNEGGHVRGNETNMGDFVTDVLRAAASEKLGVDLAFSFIPGYCIRSSVEANVAFTNIEIASIFGMPIRLIAQKYTADDIVKLVTGGLTAVNPSFGPKFIQMSGINVTYTKDDAGKGTPVTIKVGETLIYDANNGGIQVDDTWSVMALNTIDPNTTWEGDEADLLCKNLDEVRELFHWYLENHEEGDGYKFYPNTVAPDNRIVEVK